MKFETILEYIVDEIKTDLNDIETMSNSPKVQQNNWFRSIKQCIGSIRDKLDMLCE
jgi:hypothetical protein